MCSFRSSRVTNSKVDHLFDTQVKKNAFVSTLNVNNNRKYDINGP